MSNELNVLQENYRDILNSVEGYKAAMDLAVNDNLKADLANRHIQRQELLGEFENRIREIDLNYNLTHETTMAGETHQGFMKLRSKMGDTDESILKEIKRGEEHLIDELQAAKKKDISLESKTLFDRAISDVQQSLTTLEPMKQAA